MKYLQSSFSVPMAPHVSDEQWNNAFRRPFRRTSPKDYFENELGSCYHAVHPGHLNPGGIQFEEGGLLTALAVAWGGPIFEIGVEYGNSTIFLDQGLYELERFRGRPSYKIYSCDIQDVRDQKPARQVFYPYKSTLVTPPEQCAWAFIDGDHSYDGVVADIKHCLNLGIKKLVFHDAREGDPTDGVDGQTGTDVLRAAEDTLPPTWELTLVDSVCGILIAEAA